MSDSTTPKFPKEEPRSTAAPFEDDATALMSSHDDLFSMEQPSVFSQGEFLLENEAAEYTPSVLPPEDFLSVSVDSAAFLDAIQKPDSHDDLFSMSSNPLFSSVSLDAVSAESFPVAPLEEEALVFLEESQRQEEALAPMNPDEQAEFARAFAQTEIADLEQGFSSFDQNFSLSNQPDSMEDELPEEEDAEESRAVPVAERAVAEDMVQSSEDLLAQSGQPFQLKSPWFSPWLSPPITETTIGPRTEIYRWFDLLSKELPLQPEAQGEFLYEAAQTAEEQLADRPLAERLCLAAVEAVGSGDLPLLWLYDRFGNEQRWEELLAAFTAREALSSAEAAALLRLEQIWIASRHWASPEQVQAMLYDAQALYPNSIPLILSALRVGSADEERALFLQLAVALPRASWRAAFAADQARLSSSPMLWSLAAREDARLRNLGMGLHATMAEEGADVQALLTSEEALAWASPLQCLLLRALLLRRDNLAAAVSLQEEALALSPSESLWQLVLRDLASLGDQDRLFSALGRYLVTPQQSWLSFSYALASLRSENTPDWTLLSQHALSLYPQETMRVAARLARSKQLALPEELSVCVQIAANLPQAERSESPVRAALVSAENRDQAAELAAWQSVSPTDEELLRLQLQRQAVLARGLRKPEVYLDALTGLAGQGVLDSLELAFAKEWSGSLSEAAALLEKAAPREFAHAIAWMYERSGAMEEARRCYDALFSERADLPSFFGLWRTGAEPAKLALSCEQIARGMQVLSLQEAFLQQAQAFSIQAGSFEDAAASLTAEQDLASQLLRALLLRQAGLSWRDELPTGELQLLRALAQGLAHERAGRFLEAARVYGEALESSEGFFGASLLRSVARDLALRQSAGKVAEMLSQEVLTGRDEAERPQRRALRLLLAQLCPEDAKEHYHAVLQENPQDLIALRGLWARSSGEEAAQHMVSMAAQLPDVLASSYLLRALSQGQSNEALLSRLLSLRPDDIWVESMAETHRTLAPTALRRVYEAREVRVGQREKAAYAARLSLLDLLQGDVATAFTRLVSCEESAAALLSARRLALQAQDREALVQSVTPLASLLGVHGSALLEETAWEEFRAGSIETAERLAKQALQQNANSLRAMMLCLRCAERRGDDEAVVALLFDSPLLKAEPTLFETLGLALQRLQRDADAYAALRCALRASPGKESLLSQLHLLAKKLGRFDDAAELSRRLYTRIVDSKQKMQAALRLGNDFVDAGKYSEALPFFLDYVSENYQDDAVIEQTLVVAKNARKLRDAMSFLEKRYQESSSPENRRIIAERLGRLYEDDLQLPAIAAEKYANALGQDPLGATCTSRLVALWKGKSEERRLHALLEGVHFNLTEELRQNPGRWEIYRRLAEIFALKGRRVRLGSIIELAKAVSLQTQLPLLSVQPDRLEFPNRALRDTEYFFLTPSAMPHNIRELLCSIREVLPKVFPRNIASFGVGRRERLLPTDPSAGRVQIERIAALFGQKLVEMYVGKDPGHCFVFMGASGLTAVIGSDLLQQGFSAEASFEMGRLFFLARSGLLPLVDATPSAIEGVLRGLVMCSEVKTNVTLQPPVMAIAKLVVDNMPRLLKRNLQDEFASVARVFPKNIELFVQLLAEEADRGGLIASHSLEAALHSVSHATTSQGEEALRALLRYPRAFALLQFALSKEYEELLQGLRE